MAPDPRNAGIPSERQFLTDVYQGEDERRPLLSKKAEPSGNRFLSTRYFVAYMSLIGFAASYACRVNMSVAITAMVNSSYSTDYSANITELCPAQGNASSSGPEHQEGEFPWTAHTQELILSSYFYGFVILQIPAGLLADIFPRSCLWMYGGGICLSCIFTLLTPLAAYHSVTALFTARFLCGLAESGTYPSMYSLMSRWAPPADRSLLLAIVYAGMPIGMVVTQPVSGLLAESRFGWSASFYLFGTVGVLWFIFWAIFVYHSPQSHPRMCETERQYIIEALQLSRKLPKSYPWLRILTSPAMMAVAVGDFAVLWMLHCMTTNLPIFLTEVLRFDVIQSGIYSSIPYAVLFLVIMVGGFLADWLISYTKFSRTSIRKLMTSLGLIPSALFMVASGYAGCSAALTITYLSLGLAFTGFVYSGASLAQMEFSPPYAGMVTAIANTVANMPGFIAPLVVGVFTGNQADMQGWRIVFWISFGIAIFAEVFFLIFGTSEVQSWAVLHVEERLPDKASEEFRGHQEEPNGTSKLSGREVSI